MGVGDLAGLPLPNSFSRRYRAEPRSSNTCPVCHRAYSRRRGAVQCTVCQQWLCLSQHCSRISRIRHYTPGWICQGCQPPTQPLTSSIPYSPVQTTRSTLTWQAEGPSTLPPFPCTELGEWECTGGKEVEEEKEWTTANCGVWVERAVCIGE